MVTDSILGPKFFVYKRTQLNIGALILCSQVHAAQCSGLDPLFTSAPGEVYSSVNREVKFLMNIAEEAGCQVSFRATLISPNLRGNKGLEQDTIVLVVL